MTKSLWRVVVGLAVVAMLGEAAAQPNGWRLDRLALQESLTVMGPLLGHRWLERTGRQDFLLGQSWQPESTGLRCIGRWSFGPSLKVSVRATADDTVICLTRGSGASLVRFRSQGGTSLQLLGDVNFAGVPRRAVLTDTLVVAGIRAGVSGLEVHGVSNPASPNLLSRVSLPMVNDIAVSDTFVYAACEDGTLRVHGIADPRNPRQLGSCAASCDLYMSYAAGYCYLVHVSGVHVVDVRNPAAPVEVSVIGGMEPYAVHVRDTFCYVTGYQSGLRVYSVSNPAAPRAIGSLSRPDAYDLTTPADNDTLLFTGLLDIISVANPANPRLVGTLNIPVDREYGVSVLPAAEYAFVANYFDGLIVVNTTEAGAPALDTAAYAAGPALDITIDGNRAFVGSNFAGMAILDVTDPARPTALGSLDYLGRLPSCWAVAARDSFAYVAWDSVPQLRSVSVSDPVHPVQAGGCDVWNHPEDMVLRDSFLYCAMDRRFQVVNVARPREPRLVGSLAVTGANLWLVDTLAYVASSQAQIVSVADPANLRAVGQFGAGAWDVVASDSVAFLTAGVLAWYSVADPSAPWPIDSIGLGFTARGLAVVDTIAYVGSRGDLCAVNVADLHAPRIVSRTQMPYSVLRVMYFAPYLYVCCWDAGVCILETASVGVGERQAGPVTRSHGLTVRPSVARDRLIVDMRMRASTYIAVLDALGRSVLGVNVQGDDSRVLLNVVQLPRGVYFVDADSPEGRLTGRFIKD